MQESTLPRFDEQLLMRVEVRTVRPDELPELEWDGEFRHFRQLYQEVYHSTLAGRAVMWVAVLRSHGVIGQVFVQLDSVRRELADGLERAYVYGFRVKPAYRNLGVGGRMLQVVEDDLKQRHFRFVTLNVGRENPDAQRFYKRWGYQVVAAEPGRWSYMDDQNQRREVVEPAWRMQKALG